MDATALRFVVAAFAAHLRARVHSPALDAGRGVIMMENAAVICATGSVDARIASPLSCWTQLNVLRSDPRVAVTRTAALTTAALDEVCAQ